MCRPLRVPTWRGREETPPSPRTPNCPRSPGTPAPGTLGPSPPPRPAEAISGARDWEGNLGGHLWPGSCLPACWIRARHFAPCSRPCEGGSWPQPPRLFEQASRPAESTASSRKPSLIPPSFASQSPCQHSAGDLCSPPKTPHRSQVYRRTMDEWGLLGGGIRPWV